MQKGKCVSYVAAGVQEAPGIRMRVRSNVRLPDSEAGQVYEADCQPFYAETVREQPKSSLTMPLNAALAVLCALFVVFGWMIVARQCRRSDLSKNITAMEQKIVLTERENQELAVQVADARDPARIGFAASQNLGMNASSAVTAQWVLAPDTRPFEEKTTAQTEFSPNSVPEGKLIGSR